MKINQQTGKGFKFKAWVVSVSMIITSGISTMGMHKWLASQMVASEASLYASFLEANVRSKFVPMAQFTQTEAGRLLANIHNHPIIENEFLRVANLTLVETPIAAAVVTLIGWAVFAIVNRKRSLNK